VIVVRLELHSAITGDVTELARMLICNDGSGDAATGNYVATVLRGRTKAQLDRRILQRSCGIAGYPRQALHVWNLVARALGKMGYR
jgi:hypothetical protein